MKLVVTGGTGVIGRRAVPALVAEGHQVAVVSRSAANDVTIEAMGARSIPGSPFDVESLIAAFAGADAVINLATNVPVGTAGAFPTSWWRHDRLRTQGAANVVAAALRSGVRRVVQEAVSFVYADGGDDWLDENSPLDITAATDPVAIAESVVQNFSRDQRVGVVLRLGNIVGDDPNTRHWLKAVTHGRPIGLGEPLGWAHLIHTDDLGAAIVAALKAPAGVYNVGAEPVQRQEMVQGYADALHLDEANFMGPVTRWLAGPRIEPLARSLRVSSDLFATTTGWSPIRAKFDLDWFDVALEGAHG